MRTKSFQIFAKLQEVIPGGVNSPVRAWPGMYQTPIVVERGEGDKVWDVDGNVYIDYCCSWGALILGHAHETVVEKAVLQVRGGSSFGMTTAVEERLARKVVELVPSIEKIRFVSSGTEATMSAVRLARGVTGRSLVLKFDGNYHGHADCFLVKAGSGAAALDESSSAGVPRDAVRDVISLSYNDVETVRLLLQERGHEIAGVILEPIAANMGVVPASLPFLQMLREETKRCGALLIFDEVISGFRVGLGGAQQLYGITPDLTALGKIVGGGFPAAAFGGKKEIMDELSPLGRVYQAGTLSGNPVAMEAGYQTLCLLERPGFYEELEQKGLYLTEGLPVCVQRAGSLITFFFGVEKVDCFKDVQKCDLNRFAHFFNAMFEQGIHLPPSQFEAWFLSSAHTEKSLKKTREALTRYFQSMV